MKRLLFTLGLLLSFMTAFSHVGLDYPAGGENFHPGQTVTIQWHIIIPHNTQNWDLYFSDDGGTNWQEVQLNISVGTLSYNWTVPDDITDQGRIKVVMDNAGGNYEDVSGDFSISAVSGILTAEDIPSVKIYPNPAHNYAEIKSEPGDDITGLQLLSPGGSIIQSFDINQNHTGYEGRRISLEGLPKGMLYLRVDTENGSRIEKIVKY